MERSGRSILDRRACLRGALGGLGISVALPGLEAMLDGSGTALAVGSPIPKRFVVWFWGNGNDPDRWTPAGAGSGWTPSYALEALAPLKDYVSVVSGMRLPTRRRNNPHAEGSVGVMGGANPIVHPSFTGVGGGGDGDWNFMTFPGPSLDQVIAGHIGTSTRFKSLEVGVTQPHGSSGPGNAIGFVSHNGPYNPNPVTLNPSDVFKRLFTAPLPVAGSRPDPMIAVRRSILDAVKEDAAALRIRLGSNDRRRVDDHLAAIRTLEQQIQASSALAPAACKAPAAPTASTNEAERSRVMGELVAMALACDLTRVVTFEFSSPASHVRYAAFPEQLYCGSRPESFHEYEHCTGFNDTVRRILKYFVDRFAVFVQTMKSLSAEAGGNLLDHSCILATSDVASGWRHGFDNFPVLVAGKAGGALRSGLHVPIGGDAAAKNFTRVPFTLLKALGVPLERWGAEQFATSSPVSELLT